MEGGTETNAHELSVCDPWNFGQAEEEIIPHFSLKIKSTSYFLYKLS